jgi:VWFA-related protein
MRKTSTAVTLILLASFAVAPLRAQQPEPPPVMSETISVGYVIVPFVAVDQKGRPVSWLTHRDVSLFVDGKQVRTDMFTKVEDSPVSYTILLDASGSMGLAGKWDGARAALSALIMKKKKGDDFALHVFSRGAVHEVVPFTTDGRSLLRAVEKIEPWGKTAFFDALAKMPDKSILGQNGARAIILITDGLDNASQLTRTELKKMLEGIDVPVYPLFLRPEGAGEAKDATSPEKRELMLDTDVLREIAETSGGMMAVTADNLELQKAIGAIERELRSQYLIGFAPTGSGDIRYRRISVKTGALVRALRVRAGYRGTAPPLRGTRPSGTSQSEISRK